MRRRFWLGLAAIVMLPLLTWVIRPAPIPDPVVRGRPISAWLDRPGPAGISEESVEAVRSLGPAAVPTFLAWLNVADSPVVRGARWAVITARIPIDVSGQSRERTRAVQAFRALGPAARSAWPAIAAIALHSPDDDQRSDAINSLTSADAEAARLIAAGATDPDREVRLRAIFAIQCLHLAADEVSYPTLERLRADPDPAVRAAATRAIGFMDVWIARSVVCLEASSPEIRALGARRIGEHASHARALLPELEAAAADPDPTVRAAVAEAIRRVRPPAP